MPRKTPMGRETQRTLFDDDPLPTPAARSAAPQPVQPAEVAADIRDLTAKLPPQVHLGTSSWSFPGWTGLVYAPRGGKPESEQRLAREGLAAYAKHPLFGSVSLDRTFYAPLDSSEYARYAAAVPDGFRFIVKAPAAITDPFKRLGGSGQVSGDNSQFLDAATAAAVCVAPNCMAFSRLNSTGSMAMTRLAPANFAPCTAFAPMPPIPTTHTVSPGWTSAA